VPTIQIAGRVIFVIFCDPDWTPCQKAQAKKKNEELNRACPVTRDPAYHTPNAAGVTKRELGDAAAAAWRGQYENGLQGLPPGNSAALGNDPNNYAYGTAYDLTDDCMQEELDNNNNQVPTDANGVSTWQVDHCVDIQFAGASPQGPLKMLDQAVNGSMGSQMRIAGANGSPVQEFRLEGCD
jgi:hypothetical protein